MFDVDGQLTLHGLTITHGAVTDGVSLMGGGVRIPTGPNNSLDVTESVFDSNVSPGYGGAIAADYVDTINISETTFRDNFAEYAGPALWSFCKDASVANSEFVGNGGDASGIFMFQSNLVVTDSTFDGEWNAIYFDGPSLKLERVTIGHSQGTALDVDNAVVTMTDSQIVGTNRAYAAISLIRSTMTMTGSTLRGEVNSAIWLDTSSLTCTNSAITGNAVVDHHGGAVEMGVASTFVSSQCDFGTGTSANQPTDIAIRSPSGTSYTAYDYVGLASFTCTVGACGP